MVSRPLFGSAPGLVRIDDAPQQYRISQGSRLWKIDERTNTAAASDSPWFIDPQHQIDLLGLLEVGVKDANPLLTAEPSKNAQYANRECAVYRADLPSREGKLRIEAFADVQTNQLVGIIANLADQPIHVGPPLAELQLVALNPPVDESKFVVAKSLTDDGRIGKIADSQGLVVLRPALAQRWTPIGPGMPIKPGDWLRTDLRGANAVKARLSSDVELTLGPGTLVEFISPTQARIHTGEVQVNVPKADGSKSGSSAAPVGGTVLFELLAPRSGGQKFTAAGKQLVRVDRDEKLATAEKTPRWLEGFEGTSSNESLGSLIVKLPDGRNEPLTVGYHKVSVEIRDQIARTTIEESFVNHTGERLEGVFYFPLPADASTSGFGMWIGNDLIEADVVEKQRAREIYETILREKKDPGLLEWTAGNLFKARVFPIEGWSEKRIKIVYTQVLPLRGNRYRYSYGLRSDLLRTKPLRELALSVQVNSALPLKSVTCPTHSVRTQQTEHSAQLDFAALEYTPDRDFEVVCEVANRTSDVFIIPHRRGDDGYFLLQLMPPGREGNWQRDVLPDGKSLELVLLCDTSASMDGEKRKQQAEFVATVLSSLGEKDRFWLAAADVETIWGSPEAMQATAENIAKAHEFLDNRGSLGWTNLDNAFEAVLKKAPTGSQIIYIGDGIVTAGESDPNSFVKKLGRLFGNSGVAGAGGAAEAPEKGTGASLGSSPGHTTFHAVTVGNTYDATVLKGIATVGHGSVRSITGDQTPQAVAKELLNEIAQPGLHDLQVEFRGVKVAAVYPDLLPQVPAGTQQMLVGRYLPTGQDQQGEVVVTGKLGNEPIRYAATVNFKDAEDGNSFIPRLWAQAHLDHLLLQGASQAIRDEIISLSEQFYIITPFTSLLVLESDADRERFGVKRRFEMRDGERFFAAGRENANYELRQQQMKRAGDWRIGLRRQVLQSLSTLGRNPQVFQQRMQVLNQLKSRLEDEDISMPSAGPVNLSAPVFGGWNGGALTRTGSGTLALGGVNTYWGTSSISSGLVNHAFGDGDVGGISDGIGDQMYLWELGRGGREGGGGGGGFGPRAGLAGEWFDGSEQPFQLEGKEFASAASDRNSDFAEDFKRTGKDAFDDAGISFGLPRQQLANGGKFREFDGELFAGNKLEITRGDFSAYDAIDSRMPFGSNRPMRGLSSFDINGPAADLPVLNFETAAAEMPDAVFWRTSGRRQITDGTFKQLRNPYGYNQPVYTTWLSTLFPQLAGPPRDPSKVAAAMAKRTPPRDWSEEAIALSKSLSRLESLWKLDGGIELRRRTETFDPRWKRTSSQHGDLSLYSPNAWLTRGLDPDAQTLVNYCNDKQRGVYSLAFLLGRSRKSYPGDLKTPPFALADFSLAPLHESYRHQQAKVEPAGENRAKLVLTHKSDKSEWRYLIDTARHVLLKSESFNDGKLISTTTYSDFVQIGGSWWARSAVTTDDKDRKTSETTFEITALGKDKFETRIAEESSTKSQAVLLKLPGPTLNDARQHVADGSADFDDRITMMLYNCWIQQWDELFKQLDAAEKLVADKPGVRWIRTVALQTIRRNDEARLRLLEEARKLAVPAFRGLQVRQPDEMYLAEFIIGQARGIASPAEQLEFVNLLKPVYDRQPAEIRAAIRWQEQLLGCYDALNRSEDALALRGKLAEESPWEIGRQTDYANRLLQAGQADAAYVWLQKQLDRDLEYDKNADEQLRNAYADLYRSQTRWADLLKFTTDWIGRKPEYQAAYNQHLSALVCNDKLEDANKLAETWLREGQIEGKLSPDQQVRLDVAISFAQGNVQGLPSNNQLNERWVEPLAQARAFLRAAKRSPGHRQSDCQRLSFLPNGRRRSLPRIRAFTPADRIGKTFAGANSQLPQLVDGWPH